MWQSFPTGPNGELDPAKVQVASEDIQRLTQHSMALLERSLEPQDGKRKATKRGATG